MVVYTNIVEVIDATVARYRGVTQLSKTTGPTGDPDFCVYGHDVNGIGCGIGCHVPHTIGARWDEYGGDVGQLFQAGDADIVSVFGAIPIHWLSRLQDAHDLAADVPAFLATLQQLRQEAVQEVGA